MSYQIYQIFDYARCITPKRVTSLRAHFHVIAPGQHSFFEELSQQRQAVGIAVFDMTGPRIELKTSRSKEVRVTSRPIGLSKM